MLGTHTCTPAFPGNMKVREQTPVCSFALGMTLRHFFLLGRRVQAQNNDRTGNIKKLLE